MDALAVRRVYLTAGADAAAAGRTLGITRQYVRLLLARANRDAPLVWSGLRLVEPVSNEDRAAVQVYLGKAIERAGMEQRGDS